MKNLITALSKAQQAIISVAKDATNSFHRYDYVSSESMVAECRAALHANGLVLSNGDQTYVNTLEHSVVFQPFNDSEPRIEKAVTVIVTRQFILTHIESGESLKYSFSFPAVPEKGRPIDKAVAGALTTSLNYFLRDLLLVPRGDENEMDRRQDVETKPQRSVPAGPTKTPPPPSSGGRKADSKPKETAKQFAMRIIKEWAGTDKPEEFPLVLVSLRDHLIPDYEEGQTLDDEAWKTMAEYAKTTPYKDFKNRSK